MQKFNLTEKIKQEWEEDPAKVIVIAATAAGAAAKLIDALSAAQGRRAYAKQIDHKIKMQRAR